MQHQLSCKRVFIRLAIGALCGMVLAGFFVTNVEAYSRSDYQALPVSISGSGTLTMQPGERRVVTAQFKNTGSIDWHNYGDGYISAYTYEPKYRRSVFDSGKWMGPTQVLPPAERNIAPGEVATISFEIHAPQELGTYAETFHLAAEDRAWVEGGEFTLNIEVSSEVQDVGVVFSTDPVAKVENIETQVEGYSAELTVTSASSIKTLAGKSILFTAGYKNTGSVTWNSFGLTRPDVQIASTSSDFTHPSWDGAQLAYLDGQSVAPGEIAIVQFAMMAPKTNGSHVTNFQLQANSVDVPGALLQIPIEVTGGSATIVNQPLKTNLPPAISLIDQPSLRIGVLIVDDEVENRVDITSHESDFKIKDTEGNLLAEVKKDQVVTAYYDNLRYYFDLGRGQEQSSYGLRFEPVIAGAVMSIENFDRRLTRGASYPDNTFRGILEYRHNDYKDREWIINEVPIEFYLRGLAETSESHPVAMNRAQIVAARTYAYFHYTRNGKRQNEFMDLNSTPSDQLYQGYGREIRSPKITRAVMDTAGEIVTYEGRVAITPYYARSNGFTKDWSQVWWGDQPHVRGVKIPCDAGKTQWGHGVGMPQSGANCLAKEGKKYDEIIKFFFTNIEIDKTWN